MVESHLSEKMDHSTRLWNLLLLELWHHEFIDASHPNSLHTNASPAIV
jgi:hypothetical protein